MATDGDIDMKYLHIIAGLLGLISGFLALYSAKGSKLHRLGGMVFVVSMLVMASSGTLMSIFVKLNRVNVVAGMLTIYLVSSGLIAVRRTVAQSRGWTIGLLSVALANSLFGITLAIEALANHHSIDGLPAQPLLVFGLVGLIGVYGDLRVLQVGSIVGTRRLARHLWRLCFALLIATSAFFLGQAKLFPEPLRKLPLLVLPVLLVLVTMIYWMVRMGRRTAHPRLPEGGKQQVLGSNAGA